MGKSLYKILFSAKFQKEAVGQEFGAGGGGGGNVRVPAGCLLLGLRRVSPTGDTRMMCACVQRASLFIPPPQQQQH